MNKYLIRTIVAGILFYFILEMIFPNLNIFLQMLIAAICFFVVQWFVPGVRRFFTGSEK